MTETSVAATVDGNVAIRVANITKDFGGLRVLRDVSLDVVRGERVTLIGPNGAGKTTLFNVICGVIPPTFGQVVLLGQDVTSLPFHRRVRLGLGRGFQISRLFPELTVAECAMLPLIRRQRKDYQFYRVDRITHDRAAVARVLADWGFEKRHDVVVRELAYGEQRRLDICLAVMTHPTVLLLDEPTAGLSADESQDIVKVLRGLPRELTCVVVSHDLRFGFEVAERVVAMHQGQIVAAGTPDTVRRDTLLREMYF